jgi:hypothetical protein
VDGLTRPGDQNSARRLCRPSAAAGDREDLGDNPRGGVWSAVRGDRRGGQEQEHIALVRVVEHAHQVGVPVEHSNQGGSVEDPRRVNRHAACGEVRRAINAASAASPSDIHR